jgi:hypothetical protein
MISGVRLVANPWVVVLLIAGYLWVDAYTGNRAQELFTPFDQSRTVSPSEAVALWELSRERPIVHRAFFDLAFGDPANVERFAKHADHIVHAVFGLRREARESTVSREMD